MLQGALLLNGSKLLVAPLNFLRELLISAFLGPLHYGVMNFVNLILAYSGFTSLGIGAAANREILYFQGKQDSDRLTQIRNTGMTVGLLLSAFFGLIVTGLMFLWPQSSVPSVVVVAVGPLVLLLTFQSWLEMSAMAQRAFGAIGRIRFVGAIAGFASAAGLTYLYGLTGLLVGMVGVQLLMVLWFSRMVDLRYAPMLDRREIWRLFRIGLPLFLGSLSVLALRTADNFIVVTFLSVKEWGYYGFALFISTYLFNVVNENARVVYQFLQERYGKTDEVRGLRNYIVVPSRVVAYFLPVAIGLIVLVAPIFLVHFLPQYVPALPALEVLLVASYFSSLASIHGLLMVTLNRQNLFLLLRAGGVVLNVLCALSLIKAGWGLVGVALASAISWGVYTLSLTWLTSRDFAMSRKEYAGFLTELIVPMGYVMAVVWGVRGFESTYGTGISAFLLQGVIFVGASTPLLIRGSAATGIVEVALDVWRRDRIRAGSASPEKSQEGRTRSWFKSVLKRIPYIRELNFFRANMPYYMRMGLARFGMVLGPEVVMLELTNACNLKCVMCGTPTAMRKMGLMSWDIFTTALAQARDLGIRRVVLHTTGESLLHRELPKMVMEAKARDFQVFLSTNGILLDERRATELLEAGLDQLRFSVEGATRETYESVRVGARYDRLLANMKRLRNLRDERRSSMRITLNSIYMRETASEVESFYQVYGPLVDYIEFSYLGNQGNHMADILLRSSTVAVNGGRRPCSLLWRSMVVSWNGDVTVCCVDLENEMVVGNIANQPLREIWRGEVYRRYRRLHLEGRQADLKLCGGCSSIQPFTSPYWQFLLNKKLRVLTSGSNCLTSDAPIKEKQA